jgi:hypothetical protein
MVTRVETWSRDLLNMKQELSTWPRRSVCSRGIYLHVYITLVRTWWRRWSGRQVSLGEDQIVWKYHEEAQKASGKQGGAGGIQQAGCAVTPNPKQPHMSYVTGYSAELRPCCLGKHFMEPSNCDKILLCKILYFIGSMGLLAEWKRWGCTIYQKMAVAQGPLYTPTPLSLM